MRMPAPRSIVTVGAVIFGLLAAGTAGATADRLITSAQIKDGTIKTVDMSSSVRKALKTKSAPGKQGPRGLPGATGPAGPSGADGEGAGDVRTWTVTFTADGTTTGLDGDGNEVPLLVSSQTIPASTAIQGLSIDIVSGDFSACTTGQATWASAAVNPGSDGSSIASRDSKNPAFLGRVVYDRPTRLVLYGTCIGTGSTFPERIRPLPTFTARFTFSTVSLATSPATAFN